MTFLQAVNRVLTKLREDTVTTVNANIYSKLIGQLVNDALQQIEAAYNWESLRVNQIEQTSIGNKSLTITGAKQNSTISWLVCQENNVFLKYKPKAWMENVYENMGAVTGSPVYYTFNGVDALGDLKVDVYPMPDSAYNIRCEVVKRTEELINDYDTILVPHYPVIQLAYALAIRERGEAGGETVNEQILVAKSALNDAIQLASERRPEELVWQVN